MIPDHYSGTNSYLRAAAAGVAPKSPPLAGFGAAVDPKSPVEGAGAKNCYEI